MPKELPIVQTYKALITAFPGAPTPAEVVVQAPNVRSTDVAAQIQNLKAKAAATGQMFAPMLMTISADNTVADIRIPIAGNGDDKASLDALATLRNEVLPRRSGGSTPRNTPSPARRPARTTSTSR